MGLDHLIEFRPFDARGIPYEDSSFDAIFSLGTLHHMDEAHRPKVLQEFVRTTRFNGIICFFEPNRKAIKTIRENDASHPDAADPTDYIHNLKLISRKIEGIHFDAYVMQKCSS